MTVEGSTNDEPSNELESWGASYGNFRDPLGYVHDVCDMVQKNEQSLTGQFSKIVPQQVIETTYESFCDELDGCIRQIAHGIPQLPLLPAA